MASPTDFWNGTPAELPSDQQFTAGPRPTFSQAFSAAYNDQANNWSMIGLGVAFSQAEQKQLDAIFAATGQRLAPLTDQLFYYALAKRANGQPLDSTDKSYLDALQEREGAIAKLRETHPEIPSYDELWAGVKKDAQQYDQTAADVGSREGGFLSSSWLGDLAGRIAGSFTYRDPLNLATLAIGGIGKTAIMRIATEAGFNSAAEAIDQFTGVQRNREMLGLENGTGQALGQIATAGVGAGVFRSAGEGVAAIGKAIAGRTAGRAANALADAAGIAQDAEEVVGPSPFGSSRVAEGIHQAELADTFRQFDTPAFVPPSNRADLMSGVSIPTLAARESDGMFTASGADAFFVGTSNPLKDVVVKDIPALRASASAADREVAGWFADLNSRINIADVQQNMLEARLFSAAGKATPDDVVRGMIRDLADTNRKLADLEATTVADAPRRMNEGDIAAIRKALGRTSTGTELFPRELSAAEVAKLNDVPVIRDRLRALGVADKPRKLSVAEVDQLRAALNPPEKTPAAPPLAQPEAKPVQKTKSVMKEIARLRELKSSLEASLSKAQAVAADVRALTASRDRAAGAANDLRLQRARLVAAEARKRPTIGRPPATPEQEAMIRDLLGTSKPTDVVTRTPGTAAYADAAEKVQKVLDDREVATPKIITPEADPATGKVPEGAVETVDIGQKGPPVRLDHQVVVGIDGEGNPITSTIGAVLEDMKDDDALIKQMKECLL